LSPPVQHSPWTRGEEHQKKKRKRNLNKEERQNFSDLQYGSCEREVVCPILGVKGSRES
jgi:hypothetical protein